MKVQYIAPQDLKVPEVRITSVFDDETYEHFKADIEKNKIEDPLKIMQDGEDLWIVDGKHRRDEALMNGFPTVPCIVKQGSMKDVLLRNLVSDRLRGKTKASEEVKVIKELREKHAVSIDELVSEYRYPRERVEQLIQIGGASPEVWEALDDGRIRVCHAFQLSRIVDRGPQVRMLQYVIQTRTNCDALKEAVEDALKIIAERESGEKKVPVVTPPPLPTATCSICKLPHPVSDMLAPPTCKTCFAYAITAHEERKEKGQSPTVRRSPIAEAILGSEKIGEQGV